MCPSSYYLDHIFENDKSIIAIPDFGTVWSTSKWLSYKTYHIKDCLMNKNECLIFFSEALVKRFIEVFQSHYRENKLNIDQKFLIWSKQSIRIRTVNSNLIILFEPNQILLIMVSSKIANFFQKLSYFQLLYFFGTFYSKTRLNGHR